MTNILACHCVYQNTLFLQTARNALYSSKPGGTKYLHFNGNDIVWTHVLQLRSIERRSQLQKTRLTNTHVELNSYSKVCFMSSIYINLQLQLFKVLIL